MNEHLAATAVYPLLLEHYELDELACEAIEAGFNHSYFVAADGQKYVLRVYLNGKYYIRDEGDFRFELDLLDFLHRHEIPVARPVPNRRGEYLTTVVLAEETRHLALFRFADGKGLADDFQPPLARQLGQIIATMHQAANRFSSEHHRYHLDLRYLLDEPLRLLEEQLIEHDLGDLAFFKPIAEELRATVEQVPRTAESYGLIHADLHSKNIHFDEQAGFTLIDFDHSAYGYRAYDLVPFRAYQPKTWPAFLEGYESIRPLLPEEKAALPAFTALRYIWDYGDIFAMLPVWGKTASKKGLKRARQRLQSLTAK